MTMALIGLVTPLLFAGIGIILGNMIVKGRDARSIIVHERSGTRQIPDSTAVGIQFS